MEKESLKSFCIQTFVPFLVAGFGMVGAGVLLDKASHWPFLLCAPEALILVPALQDLKGNLQMTLASRLSTMAHLGNLDQPQQQLSMLYSSFALDQAQAIVVALIASFLAVSTSLIEGTPFDFGRSLYVVLSGTASASVTSMLLTSLMVFTVIMARRFGLDPDNIATPLAAATGDIVSLAFLVLFGNLFYQIHAQYLIVLIILFLLLLFSVPFWVWVAVRVRETRAALLHGWYAILISMLISSSGGYILRHVIQKYPGFGRFQPVISGVGGNLVAVQASKLSTYLHQFGTQGILPENTLVNYMNPLRTFTCKGSESRNAVLLLLMSVPGNLFFTGLIWLTNKADANHSHPAPDLTFLFIYLCVSTIQVAILLYICQLMCRCLWRLHLNPDENAIPLLTSLGDLMGSILLAFAFFLHAQLVKTDAKIGFANNVTIATTIATNVELCY